MTRDAPECPRHPQPFWQVAVLTAIGCALPTLIEQLGKLTRERVRQRRDEPHE